MKVTFKGINQSTLLKLLSIGLDVEVIDLGIAPNTFKLTVKITTNYSLTVHANSIIIYDTDDIDSIEISKQEFSEVVII